MSNEERVKRASYRPGRAGIDEGLPEDERGKKQAVTWGMSKKKKAIKNPV